MLFVHSTYHVCFIVLAVAVVARSLSKNISSIYMLSPFLSWSFRSVVFSFRLFPSQMPHFSREQGTHQCFRCVHIPNQINNNSFDCLSHVALRTKQHYQRRLTLVSSALQQKMQSAFLELFTILNVILFINNVFDCAISVLHFSCEANWSKTTPCAKSKYLELRS